MDNTSIYNIKDLRQELILFDLNEIIISIEKNGYNPSNQLVGYILSGDSTYITSKDNAREKIEMYEPNEILHAIINGYLGV